MRSRCHRLATLDGIQREVRMLCNSMMNNNYVLCADKTIKYVSAKSVLKYEVGEAIRLSERDFILLSQPFLAEVERKYR